MSADEPPPEPSLEERKFEAEAALLRRELELRSREVQARELEVKAKERESRWPTNAIITAGAVILVAIATQWFGGCENRRLQQMEMEGNLIVAAARSESKIAMADLLDFFLDAGVIRDADGLIRRRIEDEPSSLPVFPTPLRTDPVDVVVGPAVVVVVSHPGLDAPATLRISETESAVLRLPGAGALRLWAEVTDPEQRRARLILLPMAGSRPPATLDLREGEVGEVEGPPDVGSLRVELSRIILAGGGPGTAAPPAGTPGGEP